MASRSASQLATQPRPSMGTFWCRCTSMWKSMTRSASANVLATSPNSLRECGREMLSPRFANSGGLLGAGAKGAFPPRGRAGNVVTQVREQRRAARVEREGGIHHRRQVVILDLHQLAAVLGEVTALGDDDRHGIAHQAHLVGGQQGELGGGPCET